jgi:hypothetical protein
MATLTPQSDPTLKETFADCLDSIIANVDSNNDSHRTIFRTIYGVTSRGYYDIVWSLAISFEQSQNNRHQFGVCFQEETEYFHNVWNGSFIYDADTRQYDDEELDEKHDNGDASLVCLLRSSGIFSSQ